MTCCTAIVAFTMVALLGVAAGFRAEEDQLSEHGTKEYDWSEEKTMLLKKLGTVEATLQKVLEDNARLKQQITSVQLEVRELKEQKEELAVTDALAITNDDRSTIQDGIATNNDKSFAARTTKRRSVRCCFKLNAKKWPVYFSATSRRKKKNSCGSHEISFALDENMAMPKNVADLSHYCDAKAIQAVYKFLEAQSHSVSDILAKVPSENHN